MRSNSRSKPGHDRPDPLKMRGGVFLLTYPEKVAYTLRAKGQLSFRGDQDTLVVCCLKTTQPTAELWRVAGMCPGSG